MSQCFPTLAAALLFGCNAGPANVTPRSPCGNSTAEVRSNPHGDILAACPCPCVVEFTAPVHTTLGGSETTVHLTIRGGETEEYTVCTWENIWDAMSRDAARKLDAVPISGGEERVTLLYAETAVTFQSGNGDNWRCTSR